LRPAPFAPVVRTYTVAPTSRLTIYLDQVPGLAETDVSGSLRSTNSVPFIAERVMYFSRPDQTLQEHESAGVTQQARTRRNFSELTNGDRRGGALLSGCPWGA